jgi:hypothetical protein
LDCNKGFSADYIKMALSAILSLLLILLSLCMLGAIYEDQGYLTQSWGMLLFVPIFHESPFY